MVHYVQYLNVNDNIADISPFFSEVHKFLKSTSDEKRILFHCGLGVSRSATLLIAFMMRSYAMMLREAFDLVKSRRAKVQPTDVYTDALIKYESEIFPERESEINFKYMTGYTSRPSSMHSKASTTSLKDDTVEEVEEGGGADKEKNNAEGEDKDSEKSKCCPCCCVS